MPVRLVVADDHEVVRLGLSLVLRQPEFQVVAMVGTCAETVSALERHQPDVLILDMRLPDGSGASVLPRARQLSPGTKTVVLTSYGDTRTLVEAMAGGADAVLLKDTDAEALRRTIRRLAAGDSVHEDSTRDLLGRLMPPQTDPREPQGWQELTPRELQIIAALARGLSNKQIGELLGITEKTVRNHMSEIFQKLGLRNRNQVLSLLATTGRMP